MHRELPVDQGRILVGMGAPMYRPPGGPLFMEAQSVSGLHAWKRSFDGVLAYAIEHRATPPKGWVDAVEAGLTAPDFRLISLPDTYRLAPFSRDLAAVRQTLLTAIQETDYRVFAYGGWLGGPGELAVSVAKRNGLKYAVWLDRIESRVIGLEQKKSSLWKAWVKSAVVRVKERRAVAEADLALLHGATVYDHFRSIAKNPHIVEDIHYSDQDRIAGSELERKIASCGDGPLKVVYVGRADPMKGGTHWLDVLTGLRARGVDFSACWLGDGSELTLLRDKARAAGLAPHQVEFAGFVSDREAVRAAYRGAHIMLFCHLTDESPRNLIESLHAATPLVGYRDPFSAGLVDEQGAGHLVARGDTSGMIDAVAALAGNRDDLADLVLRASRSASTLTRERVFEERSEIIKRELG
jgi:colanic acid/amylovoran biosynthesis glycosyltransferase